ncbi:MAG: hypothetical protein ACQUHE_08830 [Bacteroidia bacterium]
MTLSKLTSTISLLFALILFCNSCTVTKNQSRVANQRLLDSITPLRQYGTIKNLFKVDKQKKDETLFDEYIANDFKLPKNRKDSARIAAYFVKTAHAQLGREFKQWDLVVIRGVLFQLNVVPPAASGRIRRIKR